MKASFLFLEKGFEEIGAIVVADVLRRAGIELKLVSMTHGRDVTGAHGITVLADELFEKIQFDSSDFFILPGGPEAVKGLLANEDFILLLQDHYNKGLRVAAIGDSPSILGQLGMLNYKNATCFPGYEQFLVNATYTAMPVEIQDSVITGRGPADVFKFAISIVSQIAGTKVADEVAHKLLITE